MIEDFLEEQKKLAHFIEKWSKVSFAEGIKDLPNRRKKLVAIALENQARYLKTLTESNIQQFFRVSAETLLEITYLIAANSKTDDVFSEWYCTTPDDAIYFVDRVLKSEKPPEGFDKYGTVDITVNKKRFNCRPFPVGYSFYKLSDLCLDPKIMEMMTGMVTRAVADEHIRSKDTRAVDTVLRLAYTNPLNLIAELDDLKPVSYNMFEKTGRGVVTNIVVNPITYAMIAASKEFKVDESDTRIGAVYLAGYLRDIAIYVARTTRLKDGELLMNHKNKQEEGDHSVVFGTMREFDYNYDKCTVETIRDVLIINPIFHQIGHIVLSKNKFWNWFLLKVMKKPLKLK